MPTGQPQTETSLTAEPEPDPNYSSSDSSVELSSGPYNKTWPDEKEATVFHPNIARPPIMSDGEVTPGVVRHFELLCETYFMYAKGISEEQKVARLLGSFKNPDIKAWVIMKRTTLAALTFPDFMKEFRRRWLPEDWEITLRAEIHSSLLDPTKETFETWVTHVQTLNVALRGTPEHLSDKQLRDQLGANLDEESRIMAYDEMAHKIEELHPWIQRVQRLDNKRRNERKRINKYIDEYLRALGRRGRS
jgi:hypothetical protein